MNVYVAPHLVNKDYPLYNIDDVYNGIVVTGNAIGDVMFYGKGAGKMPTASAIIADIIDILNKTANNIIWEENDGNYVADYKKEPVKLYIRAEFICNTPESFINDLFPKSEIFIAKDKNEIYFFTKENIFEEFEQKINILSQHGFNVITILRIL